MGRTTLRTGSPAKPSNSPPCLAPLTFLGGSFYSIDMLPPNWRTITLANPVVYLISGFRWSFYGTSDISAGVSLVMIMAFLIVCLAAVAWIFKTGYRLRA